MARRYGRCPRGERLIGRVPLRTWKTLTFAGRPALRRNDGALVIGGATYGEIFVLRREMLGSRAQRRRYRRDGPPSSPQGRRRRGSASRPFALESRPDLSNTCSISIRSRCPSTSSTRIRGTRPADPAQPSPPNSASSCPRLGVHERANICSCRMFSI